MYMEPTSHASITGQPVVIGEESGSEFRAFGDMLTGTMLQIVRPHLIVQSWRSANFRADDEDSTLILSFSDQGDEGRIDLVHLDVPTVDYDGVTEGWENFYWTPWREYLKAR
jgi:hypothetical protein